MKVEKLIRERLEELKAQNLSWREMLVILYLERYPIFEMTQVMGLRSSELKEAEESIGLSLLRCPVGHRLPSDPALHARDAHYCVDCQRWFNEATLRDEIELEIERLKEKEASSQT